MDHGWADEGRVIVDGLDVGRGCFVTDVIVGSNMRQMLDTNPIIDRMKSVEDESDKYWIGGRCWWRLLLALDVGVGVGAIGVQRSRVHS